MMKNLITLAIFGLLTACSGVDINTDYALEQNFNDFSSYQWHPDGVAQSRDLNTFGGDIFDSRMRRIVEDALESRGIQKTRQPDFYINYGVVTNDRVSIRSYNSYGGYGPGWHGGYGYYGGGYGAGVGTSHTSVSYYTQGMIILDVIDAKTNKLIWRSTADSRLDSSSTPEKKEKNLRKIVDGMLRQFPPPAKS